MPADPCRIDDMDLAAPWIIGRGSQSDAGISIGQPKGLDFRPVKVEIVDFDDEHLIFLPDRHVDVLQEEIGLAEAKPGVAAVLPDPLEAKLLEEPERARKVRSGRDERIRAVARTFMLAARQ